MNRRLRTVVLGGLVAFAPVSAAWAISIDLVPNSVAASVGDTFSVNVVVSGLIPQGTARSEVGAFDLDLTFNPAAVSLANVAFGTLLGDPTSEALTDVKPGAGIVNFAEVSLLPTATLDALQPDTFTLASLSFRATAPGTSTLTLSRAVVASGSGAALGVVSLGATQVKAGGAPAIPEPNGFLLFAIGFATVARFATRRAGSHGFCFPQRDRSE